MAQSPQDAEALLPLKTDVFHILLVLLEGDRHGYAIVKELEGRAGYRKKILPGNLYRTINAMFDDGLIEESDWRPDPALDDERRRYFCLTELGHAVARAEAARLMELVRESRAKDLLAAPGSES